MKSNSLLLTCNCSAALGAKQFSELVSTQANMVGKSVKILGIYGPASCHPTLANFPEGQYLTAVLIAVE
jgi:23S rRNA (cytosine1962-C5)-methyltransferase